MDIEVRALNDCVGKHRQGLISRRVLFALSRFRDRVRNVLVRLEDVNGPRGGLDQRCAIEVRMRRGGCVYADAYDRAADAAVGRAATRIARRVRDTFAARRDRHRRSGHDVQAEFT